MTYRYDELGQLVGWTDPQGHVTALTYDALGNRISEEPITACVLAYVVLRARGEL